MVLLLYVAATDLALEIRVPVLVHLNPATVGDFHPVARFDGLDILKNCPLIHQPARIGDALDIPFWLPPQRLKGLSLCGQDDSVTDHGPYQWLNTEAITDSNDALAAWSLVHEDESKLAAEMLKQAGRPVDLVEGDNQLAVAVASESIPVFAGADVAEPVEIVNLAIDHSVDGIVGVVDGLGARRREVVDGQAAVTEAN